MSADRARTSSEADGARRRGEHLPAARVPAADVPGPRGPAASPVSVAGQLLTLQRTAGNRGVEMLLGPGWPLEPVLRQRLEARVGTRLDDVRTHSGTGAARLASALRARAFTFGHHIGFATGELTADLARGERLLTHEAAHIAQQRRGPASRSSAEADARAVARGVGPARSGAPAGAVLLADATTEAEPPAQQIVLDDSEWTPDHEDTLLSFRAGDQLFLLSGYPIVLRVPPRQAAEVRAIFGVPAVGSAGSAVVSTGHGQALMIDVGTGLRIGDAETARAIYLGQLSALLGRMGITEITDIYISHGHADHLNRLKDTVEKFNIPAQNVTVPDYQARWSRLLRDLWQQLAQSDKGRQLGYDQIQPGARLYTGDPNAQVYRARLETGDIVLEFYADPEAMRKLAGKKAGSKPGELLDSASALILISQIGTPFRMAVLGDLRGRDIHALRLKMDREHPGSFGRTFSGVEVSGGMQHHLGVVSSAADLAGIADILEVTALARGRLEVVVQTDDVQMRPRLVEALNLLGVDVTVALTAAEAKPAASVTVTSESAVDPTGAAARQFEAPAASRTAVQRIAELRQRELTVSRFGRNLQQAGAVADPDALRSELAATRANAETAYRELQEQTIGRLQRSNAPRAATAATMDAVRFDEAAISSRIARIMAPGLAEQSLARTWGVFTVADLLDLLGNQRRMDKELYEQVSNVIETGRASQRVRQLIEIVSPAYVREVIGPPSSEREAREQLMWMSRQAQLSQAGYNAGAARPYGATAPALRLRGGAAVLALLEVGRIGLDVAKEERANRAMQRHRAFGDFLWWQDKGAAPPFAGVIDHWGDPDEVITVVDESGHVDQNKWEELVKRGKDINALTLGAPQDDGSWFRFTFWVENRIQNFDDFREHFMEGDPPVSWKGNFDTGTWSVRVSTWSDWVGPWFDVEENEQLTKIMNATASRVISGTKQAIERTWARRDEPLPERETTVEAFEPGRPPERAAGTSPLEELQPTRRAHFKPGADHELFSVAAKWRIIAPHEWPSKSPPYFLVFENEPTPAGLLVVGGADYRTYVAIRMAWTYACVSVVSIPRRTGILFRTPTLSPEQSQALRDSVERRGVAQYVKHPDADKVYEAEVRYFISTPNYGAVALARSEDLEFEP